MASKKIQLYTDRDKTIEASPETSANCVILSDGNDLQKVLDNDLTNPTVVHEETSFKVGAGDIDVSSSVVDGEVGRMVIKGKTYQNILPEPSTHVLTNNKEMFKVNEGLDPNVEIVDGVSKSAILSGNTLVNISRFTKMSVNSSSVSVDDDGWVTVLNPTGNYNNAFYGVTGLEKPNTQYTLILEIKENTRTGAFSFIQRNDYYPSVFNLVQNISIEGGFVGTKKFLLTTKEDLSDCLVTSRTFVDSSGGTLIFRQVLIEGDYTDVDIPYFEGMTSCKLPVLSTVGKNLFDSEKAQSGYLGSDPYGINRADHSNKTSDYIRVKPNTSYTYSLNGFTASQVGSEYWTGWYYYTSPTEVSKKNMNRQVSRGSADTFKTVTFTTPSDCYYVRIGSRGLALDGATVQLEEGSTATSYEPHKSNILHTPEEVVLRSLPNGVCDTLNLNTGEYVQRIKEIVLDGSSRNDLVYHNVLKEHDGQILRMIINNCSFYNKSKYGNCDKLPFYHTQKDNTTLECVFPYNGDNHFYIQIKTSRIDGADSLGHLSAELKQSFCNWLAQNPLTVQYELATPIVKTVDLSSSGNWEKVVYNGMESWNKHDTWSSGELLAMHTSCRGKLVGGLAFSDKFDGMKFSEASSNSVATKECIRYDAGSATIYVFIKKSRLQESSIDGFKQWLKDNGLTVWYQTETHLDSTQVKQPIFFKDGHIIQSSGADNSLIPTLDYQAKTSNSYVMDLMKTNTRYTMKAKSASGTFTIDGTSYGAGTNGTFTTPSSMTNKLLVMSNKTNTEVMILEGDVTSKTIPYFKGIKSAFEGEDKIEVLSTGKNLTHHILGGNPESKEYNFMNIIETHKNTSGALNRAKVIKWVEKDKFFIKGYGIDQYDNQYNIDLTPTVLKPNTTYFISFESIEGSHEQQEDMKLTLGAFNVWLNNTRVIRAYEGGTYTFTTPSQVDSFNLNLWLDGTKNKNATIYAIFNKFMITEGKSIDEGYEPHKSNNTKIPLLSPLRSLPNGVCDELIIDRMKKKATLIQRVGYSVINSEFAKNGGNWGNTKDTDPCWGFHCGNYVQGSFKLNEHNSINDKLPIKGMATTGDPLMGYYQSNPHIAVRRLEVCNLTMAKEWLDRNPIDFYYQLATPVVAEIDLENFPLVYKDGHIFLNSEIAPVVEIDYNINQSQQIQSNNETLQRHELDILDLDNLIVSFVNAEYNLRLLKFDMELSMMALAE